MKIRRNPFLMFTSDAPGVGDEGGSGGATPPTPPEASTKTDDPDLGDAGKKALKAEREQRKAAEQALRDAEARIKQFEDAQKTQEERDSEARAALEGQARENALKALKYEAAEKAGIPLKAAMRLTGETLDDLVADAEELKSLGIGTPAPPTPQPDLSQGGAGGKTEHKNLQDAVAAHYER